jgi:hypothetical protein
MHSAHKPPHKSNMIESLNGTDFKKAPETNTTSEFDYYDDGVEYVEYNIDQAENRVQVVTTRRHDADPAGPTVGASVQQ